VNSVKLSRRRFMVRTALAGAGMALGAANCGQRAASRPNFVLIMADDMGFSDIGCYGSDIETPNLDRLAAGGLRFSTFYNAARCCPTRASLLTGLYPHQAGMGGMVKSDPDVPRGPYQGYLNNRCVTIAELLKKSGYRTYMSGKWHVGENRPNWPCDRGFDRYFGLISGGANYFDLSKGKREGIERKMARDDERFTPPDSGFYMTDAFSENAVRFLEEHRERSPFFLYLAYTAPHWPLHALPEDIDKYRGRFSRGWQIMRQRRYQRLVDMEIVSEGWPLSPLDEEVTPWEKVGNKVEMELKMAVYAAQIDRMDRGIGRVLDQLERMGAADNTLVMFLSDNGGCHEGGPWGFDLRENGLPPGGVDSYMSYGRSWANASNTPFRMFKHWVHEGGISTPLIARWPGVVAEPGSVTHQTGHIIDIMATCLDAAGATYPETFQDRPVTPLEGHSLVPVLRGRDREAHPALFWEHMGNRAVRAGKWKLVARKGEPWELYDLENDRTELDNVAPRYPHRVHEMAARYQTWAEKCGVRDSG